MKGLFVKAVVVVTVGVFLTGCTFIFQKGRRSDQEKIEKLSAELQSLQATKHLLEDRLAQEIDDKQVSLAMMDKGLVITVVGDLLFDSGKDEIRNEAYSLLSKVSGVLLESASEFNIGIEGHTDNQPIQYSGWDSNWELSSARALSVLHYLVDEEGISPDRLSAIGYGEYRPVASNASEEGQQLNRRVEIVILPYVQKVRDNAPAPPSVVPAGQKIK
ncbi:MAG: OmpA family protein [Candidatus Omnitrophica bacterium]|nr:OmpA family protein [Candidatus Omnitrophota bacterium]